MKILSLTATIIILASAGASAANGTRDIKIEEVGSGITFKVRETNRIRYDLRETEQNETIVVERVVNLAHGVAKKYKGCGRPYRVFPNAGESLLKSIVQLFF